MEEYRGRLNRWDLVHRAFVKDEVPWYSESSVYHHRSIWKQLTLEKSVISHRKREMCEQRMNGKQNNPI